MSENRCLQGDLDRANAELARYTAAAIARIRQGDDRADAILVSFSAGRAAWAKYRDAECDTVVDSWEPGTIAASRGLICERHLTEARTHEIWANFLTYGDSTPPTLPEPATGAER